MRKFHCTYIHGNVRPRCQPAKLRLTECQCLKLSLLNATVFRRIQNWAKVFASVQGRKLHDAKITTVYSNCKDAFI